MTKELAYLAASLSLAFVLAAPAAFAQTAGTKETTKSTPKTATATRPVTDASFAKEAAEGGMAEVKLGQLAEDKGASQQVKDFGKRMVDDHSKADDQLKSAASSDKIALPDKLNTREQAEYDRLSKLSGTAFDRAYARDMLRDHETDVAAFRREADDGKDASIKNFASQTLPTLQDHLKTARQMFSSVSAKNGSTTTGQKKHTGA
jgi:putative membrane protein